MRITEEEIKFIPDGMNTSLSHREVFDTLKLGDYVKLKHQPTEARGKKYPLSIKLYTLDDKVWGNIPEKEKQVQKRVVEMCSGKTDKTILGTITGLLYMKKTEKGELLYEEYEKEGYSLSNCTVTVTSNTNSYREKDGIPYTRVTTFLETKKQLYTSHQEEESLKWWQDRFGNKVSPHGQETLFKTTQRMGTLNHNIVHSQFDTYHLYRANLEQRYLNHNFVLPVLDKMGCEKFVSELSDMNENVCFDDEHHLSCQIDVIGKLKDMNAYAVIENKTSKSIRKSHCLQVAINSMILEKDRNIKVNKGFVVVWGNLDIDKDTGRERNVPFVYEIKLDDWRKAFDGLQENKIITPYSDMLVREMKTL